MLESGDAAGAVGILEDVTRYEPQNWRAFAHLGVAYARCHRYETAIGALKHACELNPAAANLFYNLGQAYEAAGVPEEAAYAYEQALQVRPDYLIAQNALLTLRQRIAEDAAASERD